MREVAGAVGLTLHHRARQRLAAAAAALRVPPEDVALEARRRGPRVELAEGAGQRAGGVPRLGRWRRRRRVMMMMVVLLLLMMMMGLHLAVDAVDGRGVLVVEAAVHDGGVGHVAAGYGDVDLERRDARETKCQDTRRATWEGFFQRFHRENGWDFQ